MNQKIAFITRCTRQDNLQIVATSLKTALSQGHLWYVIFDSSNLESISTKTLNFLNSINCKYYIRSSEGDSYGYDIMNDIILNEIPAGHWVHIIDDDNILHEDLLTSFKSIKTKCKVIVADQLVAGKDFTGLHIRIAAPENTVLQGIDVGQIIIDRDFLMITCGGFDLGYCGDGIALEKIHKKHPNEFYYINVILSYYNYIERKVNSSDPRVLYVGNLPTTPQSGGNTFDYESDSLNIKHLPDDSNVQAEISKFKPDVIATRSKSCDTFTNLYGTPFAIRRKWVHFSDDVDENNGTGIYNAAMYAILTRDTTLASVFTSAYNIGSNLYVAYNSLAAQTYIDWEWVIVNDSTDNGKTQKVIDEIMSIDSRVKCYTFEQKSGGIIGETKYRAAMLCNGEYLMELDHDDVITPDAIELMVRGFKEYPDVGFIYSDCIECDVNHQTTKYVEGFAFGYGNYYDDTYKGVKVDVNACVPINPKTIRHIVGVPNHFRAWRRDHYHAIGGHNRNLTIADDYELIVRSFLTTRFLRIPKSCYVQYYYGQNTQDSNGGATRRDIQRRVATIASHYNEAIKNRFEELGMIDWAYAENSHHPLNAPSVYDQGDAAYTMKL